MGPSVLRDIKLTADKLRDFRISALEKINTCCYFSIRFSKHQIYGVIHLFLTFLCWLMPGYAILWYFEW